MITFDKSFYTIWLLISRGWGWGKKCLLLSRRQTCRVTQLLEWSWFIQGRATAFTLMDTYNNAMEYVRYLPFLSLDPSLKDLLAICSLLWQWVLWLLVGFNQWRPPSEAWWSEESEVIYWFLISWFLPSQLPWLGNAPFYNFGLLCGS